LISALIIIVSLGFAAWLKTLKVQEFKPNLKGLSIKGIEVTGDTSRYDIIDGNIHKDGKRTGLKIELTSNQHFNNKVIGLGYLYRVIKEDPLFVSPELDTKKFRASLDYLAEEHDGFINQVGLKQNIVPLDFLKTLPKIAEKQSSFLNKPTSTNANQLIKSYKASLYFYRKELRKLIQKIEKSFPYTNEQDFVNIASSATNRIILNDLKLMLKNAKALEGAIALREKALDGNYDQLKNLPEIKVDNQELERLKRPASFLKRSELYLSSSPSKKLYGPYKITTSAFGESKVAYFYTHRIYVRNKPIFMPKLATDNYYQALVSRNPVERKLIDKGYLWHPVRETNTYRNSDLEYQADLLALDRFIKNFRGRPVFKQIVKSNYFDSLTDKQKSFINSAEEVESRFFSLRLNSDKNLKLLGLYYLRSYELLKDSGYSETKNKLQEELLKRYLFINNKMSGLELIFNTNFYFDNLLDRAKLGLINKKSIPFLYTIRNVYPLSFFNFSKAVWRLKQKPRYVKESTTSKAKHYATRTELLKKYSKAKILSWNKLTEEVMLGKVQVGREILPTD